jgi:predicted nucleic acid-binding protein
VGSERPRALVLDAGALIAFERNRQRVTELIRLAIVNSAPMATPAGVVAQVWRDGSRQARLARLIRGPHLDVSPLDATEAMACGVLAGRSGVTDVVDCSVALLARRTNALVVSSDPDDLARIDPTLEVLAC